MNCKNMKDLALKYELGEVNYFEKLRFERHVEKCPNCTKEYKKLILLGVLLASSSKTYTPSAFKLLMSSFLVKLLILTSVISGGILSIYTANVLMDKSIEKRFSNSPIKENMVNEELNVVKETKEETVDKSFSEEETFSIISSENGKELEIKFGKERFEIKNRKEK